MPFAARACTGKKVLAKALLIEVFLLIFRSRINKQSCCVVAGFVQFIFSQEAFSWEKLVAWEHRP